MSDRTIILTQGYTTIIDDEDYTSVVQHNWWAHETDNNIYARGTIDGKRTYLHRFLMNPDDSQEVDHEDGDGLNNRRSNLRVCTHKQNGANHKKIFGQSIYKGVYWYKRDKKWRAQIGDGVKHMNGNYGVIFLGAFTSEEEAAKAYDKAAKVKYGDFAKLNFPGD